MKLRVNQSVICIVLVFYISFHSFQRTNEANLQPALSFFLIHCQHFVGKKHPQGKMKNRSIKMLKRSMAYFVCFFNPTIATNVKELISWISVQNKNKKINVNVSMSHFICCQSERTSHQFIPTRLASISYIGYQAYMYLK